MSHRRIERNLRLGSGLVMAVFVVLHLLNHILGIVSFGAMEALRPLLMDPWGTVPGQVLLYGALLTHVLLAHYSLYRRRTLRMPVWEATQLGVGLAIPVLLAGHVVGTRVADWVAGVDPDYYYVVGSQMTSVLYMIRQPLLVLAVWVHLVIAMHFWLRLREGYRRWLPLWYALALLVPVLALAGFLRAGLTAVDWLRDPQLRQEILAQAIAIPDPARSLLRTVERSVYATLAVLLAAVFAARAWRSARRRRDPGYHITHTEAGVIRASVGLSLLEALRRAGVPHAAVCGGRARCTTCRVRVGEGLERLAAASHLEAAALERLGADPNVRLACQLFPRDDLTVTPLVAPNCGLQDALAASGSQGAERDIVALFVDMRGSTRLAEAHLPYDSVFILNRFNGELAAALEDTGGHYSQFTGDGLMALYGLGGSLAEGCRAALAGAANMFHRLERLNRQVCREFDHDLRMGLGIHCGHAIVGRLGPPGAPVLTAIGDTVNIAARLETLSKRLDRDAVISVEVFERAGLAPPPAPPQSVTVRGRERPIEVYALDGTELCRAIESAGLQPGPAASVLSRQGR